MKLVFFLHFQDLWASCCLKQCVTQYSRTTENIWHRLYTAKTTPNSCMYTFLHGFFQNSVIIYSPSSSPKPEWMTLFCWTQMKIFWRMWETEQFWGTIDFHSIFFLLWKSMVPQNSLVTNFLQNIFLCVQQNKDIHSGLGLLQGE